MVANDYNGALSNLKLWFCLSYAPPYEEGVEVQGATRAAASIPAAAAAAAASTTDLDAGGLPGTPISQGPRAVRAVQVDIRLTLG